MLVEVRRVAGGWRLAAQTLSQAPGEVSRVAATQTNVLDAEFLDSLAKVMDVLTVALDTVQIYREQWLTFGMKKDNEKLCVRC